jgi:hypothetical protein
MTYHLTDDGPKPCKASVRACPLGGEHFEELKDAETAFEAQQPGMASLKRTVPTIAFSELFEQPDFSEDDYRKRSTDFLSELSVDEVQALADYTLSDYADLNEALYKGNSRKKRVKELVTHIDSAMKSAPEAPKNLWRSLSGFDLPQQFIGEGKAVGDVVAMKGYTSTSQTPDALMHIPSDTSFYMREVPEDLQERDDHFIPRLVPSKEYTEGPARNVLLKINTKKAAPVSTLRSTVNEQEWLIPRGKKFRIVAIHRSVDIGELEYIRGRGTRAQVFELEEI